jgi:hypothetical protein
MGKNESVVLLNYETFSGFIYTEVYLAKIERKKKKWPPQNELESSGT